MNAVRGDSSHHLAHRVIDGLCSLHSSKNESQFRFQLARLECSFCIARARLDELDRHPNKARLHSANLDRGWPSNQSPPKGPIGWLHLPSARPSLCENELLFGWCTWRTWLTRCKRRVPACILR